jgi:hypothetical protein
MRKLLEKYPKLTERKFLIGLFAVIIVAATVHRLLLGPGSFNNFSIFRWSFFNLCNGNDLYIAHPDQYYDLYKYSPTFAMLMAPFFGLPEWAGVFGWNLLNALLPLWAVNKLKISPQAKAFVLLFVLIELLSSVQNAQSNGIMAGLMIAAFASMEDRKPVLAALLICLGFYIKIFAAAAGLIFFFYDQKARFLLACVFWGILLAVFPVIVAGFDGLMLQYKSWLHLLQNDPAHELNFSIMTLTQRWFRFTASDVWYLVPGVLLLAAPLLRKGNWSDLSFRLMYFASILVWVVIFNHKAESPTYVIAMFGVAFWGITEPRSKLRTALLLFAFVLTGLSATDLFPPYVRTNIIVPYCLKALPCIVLWLVMEWRLLSAKQFSVPAL